MAGSDTVLASQSKGKGKPAFKGKGKSAYEVHANEYFAPAEPDHFEVFDGPAEEDPPAEMGGGEIGQVESPWNVVARRSRTPKDMRPSRNVSLKQACMSLSCSHTAHAPRWQLKSDRNIESVDVNVIQEVHASENVGPNWENPCEDRLGGHRHGDPQSGGPEHSHGPDRSVSQRTRIPRGQWDAH